MALTRFSFDFAIKYTMIAVAKKPFIIPLKDDSAGKFKIATPIMNFMNEMVTSLSVSKSDSLIKAFKGGFPS